MPARDKQKLKEYQLWYRQNRKDKMRESQRKYRENNPEKRKESWRQWQQKNPERVCATTLRWQERNPDKVRALGRLRTLKNHGLSPEEFDRLFHAQQGMCSICKDTEIQCIDHNHATGEIRGLLCHSCNKAIGHLREDRQILQGAIDYLDRYGANVMPPHQTRRNAMKAEAGNLQLTLFDNTAQ